MDRDGRKQDPITDEDIIVEIAAIASRENTIREFEKIANDPDAPDLSLEAAESLHQSVMADFARYRKKQAKKKAARRALRVAACFAVLVVSLSFVLIQVDVARVAVVNYVIKTFPQYSEIHYDVESNAYPPLGWKSPYYPTWLPEGTRVIRIQIEDNKNHYIGYKDRDGYEFQFCVFSATSEYPAYDMENMTTQIVRIGAYDAILSYDEMRRIRTLVVPTLENIFMIRGTISEFDIVKIGERINFYDVDEVDLSIE